MADVRARAFGLCPSTCHLAKYWEIGIVMIRLRIPLHGIRGPFFYFLFISFHSFSSFALLEVHLKLFP